MKKLTLLLLLLVSTNVFAEWTKVGVTSDGTTTVYVDFKTIKKKGHKVKMWYLLDDKTAKISTIDNARYFSSVAHDEFSCDEDTLRQLDIFWYSGNMRRGDIIYSSQNIKSEPLSIPPESINELFYKIACGKR
jgi:hypothetical protein